MKVFIYNREMNSPAKNIIITPMSWTVHHSHFLRNSTPTSLSPISQAWAKYSVSICLLAAPCQQSFEVLSCLTNRNFSSIIISTPPSNISLNRKCNKQRERKFWSRFDVYRWHNTCKNSTKSATNIKHLQNKYAIVS